MAERRRSVSAVCVDFASARSRSTMDVTCLGDASCVVVRRARGIIHSLVPLCSTEAPCIIFRALVRRLLRADFEIGRGIMTCHLGWRL